jgi:hypothetical protein
MSTATTMPAETVSRQPPRLLDQVRQAALQRFGRPEPGERYGDWVRRYVLFHGKRHPRELAAADVCRFLEHVAQTEKDPLRCLDNAHEALTFLYQDLLHLNLGELRIPEPPRLLDRMRRALRVGHYSPNTEACYLEWVERFIRFHGLRHPNTMGAAEIEMFLTDLAVQGHVAASTRPDPCPPCHAGPRFARVPDRGPGRADRSTLAAAIPPHSTLRPSSETRRRTSIQVPWRGPWPKPAGARGWSGGRDQPARSVVGADAGSGRGGGGTDAAAGG